MELILKGIVAKGVMLNKTWDSEEAERVYTVEDTMRILDNLDECVVHVIIPFKEGCKSGWLRFVMGNDPEEVLNDCTTNLSEFVDPITDPWWK